MHLATYIAYRLGRSVDIDGAYGAQCTDLINDYVKSVFHFPYLQGNAVDFFDTKTGSYTKVENSPTNAPAQGDIVCWHSNVPAVGIGPYGHVAIALAADDNRLVTLDQNWAGTAIPRVTIHSYDGVRGWLHPES